MSKRLDAVRTRAAFAEFEKTVIEAGWATMDPSVFMENDHDYLDALRKVQTAVYEDVASAVPATIMSFFSCLMIPVTMLAQIAHGAAFLELGPDASKPEQKDAQA